MSGSPGMPFEIPCFSVQLSAHPLRDLWIFIFHWARKFPSPGFTYQSLAEYCRYLPESHPLEVGKISGAGKIRKSRMEGIEQWRKQNNVKRGEEGSRKHKNGREKKGKAEKNSKKKLHAINYNHTVLMFHYSLSKQKSTLAGITFTRLISCSKLHFQSCLSETRRDVRLTIKA